MSRDLRNLVVAVVLASVLSAVTWYFTQRWLALIGVRYGGSGTGNLLAYLPGWALLLQELLPGFVVGLVATRWQIFSGALVSYVSILCITSYSLPSIGSAGTAEVLLGKSLLYAAYGIVGVLAGCYVRSQISANYSLKRTAAGLHRVN